jgi:hypothetical protein
LGEPNSLKLLVKPEELAALKDALSLSEINGAAIAAAIDIQPLKVSKCARLSQRHATRRTES